MVHAQRLFNFTEVYFAKVLICQCQLWSVFDLLIDNRRNADAPWFSRLVLQQRREIHAISMDSHPFYADIPQVDTDTKLYPAVGRQLCVSVLQFLLDLNRAEHGVYGAGKQSEQIITSGGTNYLSVVLLNQIAHDLQIAMEGPYGCLLIFPNQATVTSHIGVED